MQLNTMLLPDRWIVQPQVTPMHVLQDPERAKLFSTVGRALAHNGLKVYGAALNCDKGRMKMVGMNPPSSDRLRILNFILIGGDQRHWAWSATRRNTNGKVRNSLRIELGLQKPNVTRSLGPLLEDGVLEIKNKQDGREVVFFTVLGKSIFGELVFRHKIRDWVPDAHALAEAYGYQEVCQQVALEITDHGYDHTLKADVIAATQGALANGIGTPEMAIPSSWRVSG